MEILRGKSASFIDTPALAELLVRYDSAHLDIGTGDGRFVLHTAQKNPRRFVIGLDACRENLRDASRRAPDNALFVIANACAMPAELRGVASNITINFPWGSLLTGLLDADPALLSGLMSVALPSTTVDVRLNAGALAEAGWPLETGAAHIHEVLVAHGLRMKRPVALHAPDLREYPTTWAKRLAFGRDPRALHLSSR
jgi:16S rRNA (adenine(1408)-N(1))-methyltransferase